MAFSGARHEPEALIVRQSGDMPRSWSSTIALAGPGERRRNRGSWRSTALDLLNSHGYSGVVFPDLRQGAEIDGPWPADKRLDLTDLLICWYPDQAPPASTSRRAPHRPYPVIVGAPVATSHSALVKRWAQEVGAQFAPSLEEATGIAMDWVGQGAQRRGAERFIPLEVWRTPEFQFWYLSQMKAHNVLKDARCIWAFRGMTASGPLWYWAIHVDMIIGAENRQKSNEVVIGRPDIVAIVLHGPHEGVDTKIVLIREYRSPASTQDGYIVELPGGSGASTADPRSLASSECWEEVGLQLPIERLRQHEARQVAGTMSAHRAQLFSAALTEEELSALASSSDVPRGVGPWERTFVEVVTYQQALRRDLDWATLGMLRQVAVDLGILTP